MKVIVPMAGRGSRLRPHTLTIPKPLVPVGGTPIVHRLVADIARVCAEPIEEIAFVVGEFGEAVEKELLAVAASLGAKGSIHYQLQALGTAHAVLCAAEALDGPVVVAFADTLFKADFKISHEDEGILWVKQIEDPSAFGVVKLDANGHIIDFVEKPQTFVSDLAMIGIYYFKDGDYLKQELQYLLDNNITEKGEFQLTNALENMKTKGTKFMPGQVTEWLDCGNKNATVYTNQRVLEFDKDKAELKGKNITTTNSVIIEPCFIGNDVELTGCIVGPHVSIGEKAKITGSILKNSIVQADARINNANVINSILGTGSEINGKSIEVSISDFSQLVV
jgi:glucose-1-phosphate thymidylyltransferase